MTSNRRNPTTVAEIATDVTAQAEALVQLWDRAEDWTVPRIPPSQLRVLGVVARHGSMNLTRLAREVGAIPSSASRLCDRLGAAGLLVRQVNPGSKREVTLTVSDEGHRRLEAFARTRRSDFTDVLERMSPPARAALVEGLAEFSRAAAVVGEKATRTA